MSTTKDARRIRLAELINARRQAKRVEDAAIADRRAIDAQILAEFKAPDGGKGTVKEAIDDVKLAIAYSLDRKVDDPELVKAFESLPDAVQNIFRFKAEVIEKAYEALPEEQKAIAAKFITTKPASPSMKLELAA
jgi:hypothetical protein